MMVEGDTFIPSEGEGSGGQENQRGETFIPSEGEGSGGQENQRGETFIPSEGEGSGGQENQRGETFIPSEGEGSGGQENQRGETFIPSEGEGSGGQENQRGETFIPSEGEGSGGQEAIHMKESVVEDNTQPDEGSRKPTTGTVVVTGNQKMPAIEKLDQVRKWSITTYKCTKQVLSEKMGRGSRTVDPELEARIDILRDDRRRYDHVTCLAQTLATQLAQVTQTQRTLGDAFTELSLKTPPLHVRHFNTFYFERTYL
uniref:Arfaptin-1-like n=1 Tax=Salmo trutta TaxID=8032 RepID=A0A673VR56_SALTR